MCARQAPGQMIDALTKVKLETGISRSVGPLRTTRAAAHMGTTPRITSPGRQESKYVRRNAAEGSGPCRRWNETRKRTVFAPAQRRRHAARGLPGRTPIFARPIASDRFESDRKTVVDVRRMNGVCFLSQHGIDYVRGYVDALTEALDFSVPVSRAPESPANLCRLWRQSGPCCGAPQSRHPCRLWRCDRHRLAGKLRASTGRVCWS